jgi:hypothetical protein
MGLPLCISVLQKADRVVFAPLCFLLTRLRKLLPEPPADQPPKPKRIVIVKLAEQGSTVLAANAIRRATEMVGSEKVYFAAFEANRFIVDVLQLIPKRNVLTVPTTSLAAMFFSGCYLACVGSASTRRLIWNFSPGFLRRLPSLAQRGYGPECTAISERVHTVVT